jgi:uncharacterized protein with von Willebrand factor type A (vWA) domain
MKTYRYSEWDGTQKFTPLDEDELMDKLSRELMQDGNLSSILWRMQQAGFKDGQGRRLPGLQEMLQKLRQAKQKQLDKYNLGSVMEDIRKKLDEILQTERQGIQKKLDEAKQKAEKGAPNVSPEIGQKLLKNIQDMALNNQSKLDKLPQDVGGQIKELLNYDFMDENARQQFQELMEMLKKHAMESYGRELTQQIKNMDPKALAAMRHFVEAINQMLEQRMRGEEPDFNQFMQEFGDFFGDQPPQNLDELVERLQKQIAQAQSLMDSVSEEDRKALEDLMRSTLDEATQYELAKMSANLEALLPSEKLRRNYPFSGEESISYSEALKLMEQLQQMDKLEGQIKDAQFNRALDEIDEKLMKEVLGDEASQELDRIRELTRVLEEAGYIRPKGKGYELTPKGVRKIGQKALKDVFARLQKDRLGGHLIDRKGVLGERVAETKKYEWGDDFDLELKQTIMNALQREPQTPPVKLKIEDFEVYETELLTRSATVLMLDLSLSMPMRGNFQAAKQVAIALDGLIRSQYPRDSLFIVGFSSYAREIKKNDLSEMTWDEFDPYTNIQHGLYLARKLLAKERSLNKQIILVTDGEPTAHTEGGEIFIQFPPSLRTIQLTLREVEYCTREGITINTFMLGESYFLNALTTRIARINKGRVFFADANNLGEYMLVDYISNKKKGIH